MGGKQTLERAVLKLLHKLRTRLIAYDPDLGVKVTRDVSRLLSRPVAAAHLNGAFHFWDGVEVAAPQPPKWLLSPVTSHDGGTFHVAGLIHHDRRSGDPQVGAPE